LSPQLALLFFGSFNLSALGGKSGLLVCRVLLGGRTTLLLFSSLQLAGFDFFFESTKGSLLLFALLLQFAFLPGFLVPIAWSVKMKQMIMIDGKPTPCPVSHEPLPAAVP
jgi:hypothetical protein